MMTNSTFNRYFCSLLNSSICVDVLDYHTLSTYEHLLFANFGETTTTSLPLVTTIDHFVANLNNRFLYSVWSIHIDFSRFRLAGGAVVICMLRDFDQEITSDLDFFYVGTSWTDFLDSIVSIFLYVHVHI